MPILVVTATRSDITTVVVTVDSIGLGMLQVKPYSVDWNTRDVQPGKHSLRATAYLGSGETLESTPVVVSVVEAQRRIPSSTGSESTALSPGAQTIGEGVPVLLNTTEKMVSGRVAEGSVVRYKVSRDVVSSSGAVLIPYGAVAQGKVTRSRRRGMFGKAGQLEFTVDSVEAADGTTVPLRAQQESAGKSNKNEVIVSTLLLSVFAVFVHGRDVELPEGTEITAYVDHDTVIERPSSLPKEGMIRGEPMEAAAIVDPADGSVATIGADIAVMLRVTPEEKFRSAVLLVNGQQVQRIEGKLEALKWASDGFPRGSYRIEADVTFTNQRVIRTDPIQIRFE